MITYLTGDATDPKTNGNKIIAHICNDVGAWGKGFVLAISKKWYMPAQEYKKAYKSGIKLGDVQYVQTEPDIWVANIIGQHDIRHHNNVPPIRYNAVRTGLQNIAIKANELQASVHMPMIGCGLAGGNWRTIEPIILQELSDKGTQVTVYHLPRHHYQTST